MSHEIRTPLYGILGLTKQFDTQDLSPASLKKLELISTSSIHLQALISDILDFAKIDSRKMSLAAEDVMCVT